MRPVNHLASNRGGAPAVPVGGTTRGRAAADDDVPGHRDVRAECHAAVGANVGAGGDDVSRRRRIARARGGRVAAAAVSAES